MYDLIYAGEDIKLEFQNIWKNSTVVDASDEIHENRFEIHIPEEVDEINYYQKLIQFGLSAFSFRFRLWMAKEPEKCLTFLKKMIDLCS